jgi:RNA polymerase sigma factor (sigma-70 family)
MPSNWEKRSADSHPFDLGQLWEEHRIRLLAMLERRIDPGLRQRVGADAVLQSTFLDAVREWEAFRAGSPIRPFSWLYRLALDRLIDEYRKEKRTSNGLGLELPLGDDGSALFGGRFLDTGTGPLTAAQKAELAEKVRKALELLPTPDRDLLVMKYFDQLSTQDMCDVLSSRDPCTPPPTENALNVRLFRALKKLQRTWTNLFGDRGSAA